MSQSKQNNGHPWIRYGAKVTDWGIILAILYFLPLTRAGIIGMDDRMMVFSSLLLIPYEVICWKFFGTTPGKMLYNLEIVQGEGKTDKDILWKRSLWSVVTGFGLGLWYTQVFTMSYQYWQLRKRGEAKYDQKLRLSVRHQSLSVVQKLIIAGTHVLAFWIIWQAFGIIWQMALNTIAKIMAEAGSAGM